MLTYNYISGPSGHYISDVYDMKKQSWLTYNDLDVSRTQEATVQRDRDRSGYIFFYMHKLVSLYQLQLCAGLYSLGQQCEICSIRKQIFIFSCKMFFYSVPY